MLSELDSYLESGLENAVGHAVSVAMTITVFRVVVFIGKEHQVDLNKKFNSKSLKEFGFCVSLQNGAFEVRSGFI